jgi:hemerythrin-like domain-containing protein
MVDGTKPDLIFVELIHESFRMDGKRLLDSVAAVNSELGRSRVPAIRAFFEQYSNQLLLHHSHEDRIFFPVVEARVGAERMRLAELTRQHEALDAELRTVSHELALLDGSGGDFAAGRETACDALFKMGESLGNHLDLEEAAVLPLVESEIPVADYKRLKRSSLAPTGLSIRGIAQAPQHILGHKPHASSLRSQRGEGLGVSGAPGWYCGNEIAQEQRSRHHAYHEHPRDRGLRRNAKLIGEQGPYPSTGNYAQRKPNGEDNQHQGRRLPGHSCRNLTAGEPNGLQYADVMAASAHRRNEGMGQHPGGEDAEHC